MNSRLYIVVQPQKPTHGMSDKVKYICTNELCTLFPTVASFHNKASIVCYVDI